MSTEARFAPGDWYAVVGDGVTVLLPVSQRGRVATLWDLADSGAAADALLDALLAGGLSSLDHFALVSHDDDSTRLIVRGAPSATVSSTGGEEILSASPGATWAEQVLTGVTSVRVTLTGEGSADHPLTAGLARVSVVEFGTPTASASAGDAAADEPAPDVVPQAGAGPRARPRGGPGARARPRPRPRAHPGAPGGPRAARRADAVRRAR